ncbi:MAG: hypothetical protein ROO71_08930 [Balneola sp.]
MPYFDPIDKMEASMRYVYGHVLADDETLEEFMNSRVDYRPMYRHFVRYHIYTHFGCTYKQMGLAESRFNGGVVTNHATFINSFKSIEHTIGDVNNKGFKHVQQLFAEFEGYWDELQAEPLKSKIVRYYSIPHHVLALITAMAVEFGHVDMESFEGLHTEFKTVSKEFIESELKKYGIAIV